MLMSTHFTIAKSVIDNIDPTKSFFFSENNFIYGNLKPDAVSKYFLEKHYLDESYDMIKSKIEYLCNLTLDDISKYFSVSKISQELGVICHFLCDFFCVAHSQRWKLNHSMSKHIIYEKELHIAAKNTNLSKFKGDVISEGCFDTFFNKLYQEYITSIGCKNDLLFSTYICNSVVNHILDCILLNTANSYTLINCG
ncbi:hypothetical protein CHL78_001920 [Romboutsia weinsteinii]|uniref:Phospholipase C/D domain-containing protein n=1 Tax=Romboutsia weinsteinii TaxID=2020949 RepID=A0A371J9V6_9FIRM|nr:zinc dependent phospholipase C family protein [Romboutsia weinsteinii]RDY29483.1 hypothetical protein CHL78_001920 [Romboutsia weinsteinii]